VLRSWICQDDDPDAPRCSFHVTHRVFRSAVVTHRGWRPRGIRVLYPPRRREETLQTYTCYVLAMTRVERGRKEGFNCLCLLQHPLSFDRLCPLLFFSIRNSTTSLVHTTKNYHQAPSTRSSSTLSVENDWLLQLVRCPARLDTTTVR